MTSVSYTYTTRFLFDFVFFALTALGHFHPFGRVQVEVIINISLVLFSFLFDSQFEACFDELRARVPNGRGIITNRRIHLEQFMYQPTKTGKEEPTYLTTARTVGVAASTRSARHGADNFGHVIPELVPIHRIGHRD